jgi:hypothetical protein
MRRPQRPRRGLPRGAVPQLLNPFKPLIRSARFSPERFAGRLRSSMQSTGLSEGQCQLSRRRTAQLDDGAHHDRWQRRESCRGCAARSRDSHSGGFRTGADASVRHPGRASFSPQQARGPAGEGLSAGRRQTQCRERHPLEPLGGPRSRVAAGPDGRALAGVGCGSSMELTARRV